MRVLVGELREDVPSTVGLVEAAGEPVPPAEDKLGALLELLDILWQGELGLQTGGRKTEDEGYSVSPSCTLRWPNSIAIDRLT